MSSQEGARIASQTRARGLLPPDRVRIRRTKYRYCSPCSLTRPAIALVYTHTAQLVAVCFETSRPPVGRYRSSPASRVARHHRDRPLKRPIFGEERTQRPADYQR